MNQELKKHIVDLLLETGRAHHAAFKATDGADPDWPIWYAENLQADLSVVLQTPFTRSELVYCLMDADFERSTRAADNDWSEFSADHFVERFAPSDAPAKDKLLLYHFGGCPYCGIVNAAIGKLDVDVEHRDIFENSQYRDELVNARGRATVPVLRIIAEDGEERWMPESRDIVRYLETTFA